MSPKPLCKRCDTLAFAVPPALVGAFAVIYLVAPRFYLTYILEYHNRELQVVEFITFGSALVGAVTLFYSAAVQWRRLRAEPGASPLPGGAVFIAVIALAALFFAGEEISWGQTYFGWDTPEHLADTHRETNLHNMHGIPISVQGLGTLFIIVMFIGLPIAWALRHRLVRLPADWAPAIAEWPVLACMALALAIKFAKDGYRALTTKQAQQASAFYVEYLDQINEQKEMLIAVGLCMYGLYRLADVRRASATRPKPPAVI